jgi:hypothetical protein
LRRRLFALIFTLSAIAGCGVQTDGQVTVPETESSPKTSTRVELAEAMDAFAVLKQLDDAWQKRDCAAVERLTTWAESTLGGRACKATRNGRPAPARKRYTEAEFFLPNAADQDRWFVALAHKPEPAYFLFVNEGDNWRIGAGPIPVKGRSREPIEGAVPTDDPTTGVKARLAPQRYLAYLTDPAGVSGVTFPKGDAIRGLCEELGRRAQRVRPDRLSTDVRLLVGPQRALRLPDGGALVIHALEIEYRQKAGPGRSSLTHPIYGRGDLRGFTGKVKTAGLTGTEVVLVATEITGGTKVSTIALRRGLATLAAD